MNDVGTFLLGFRVIALAVIGFWVVNIAVAYRKPANWRVPHMTASWPFPRPTRKLWIVAGLLGITAGCGLLLFSVWFEEYLAP
jgi:hypothetical protein